MRGALLAAAGALWAAGAAAQEPGRHQRLAASLFGETVGEVRLVADGRAPLRTLTYRSDLLVVRDRVRLRQHALLEAAWDERTGALSRSSARRCTGPADGSAPPTCSPVHRLGAKQAAGASPALAAEILLAQGLGAPGEGGERCLEVIDEESGARGRACARVTRADGAVELTGSKMGTPFRARLRDGLPELFELPDQGARFVAADGEIDRSEEDLFADPVPSTGDAAAALRRGLLRARLSASPAALAGLQAIALPWQKVLESGRGTATVEISRVRPPGGRAARRVLDAAALLVAQAAGGHVDCQTATAWFLARAKERGWQVRPVNGVARVDGRFAFHSWAIVEAGGVPVPVDPLLAQVPADPSHVVLAEGADVGAVLVAARRGLVVSVLK